MDGWTAYLVVVGAVLFLTVAGSLHGWRRTRGRWGARTEPLGEGGDGVYRSGPRYQSIPLHAPGNVTAAAVAARLWAVVTLLVFVPSGAVAALLAITLGVEETVLSLFFGIAIAGLVLSGLLLSFALFGGAASVEKRESLEETRSMVRWSLWHHALVAVVFVGEGLVLDADVATAALYWVVPVCLAGMGMSRGLRAAAIQAATAEA